MSHVRTPLRQHPKGAVTDVLETEQREHPVATQDSARMPHVPTLRCPHVTAVLERGVTERFYLFPENGSPRRVERWSPPYAASNAESAAVEARLAALEQALAPAGRGELLARVLTLLSHYRVDAHPAAVEMRIADDWAEDLAPYPMWAVDEAARAWRRSKKFKPQISEMLELCERAAGQLLLERSRLRQVADREWSARTPVVRQAEQLARDVARHLKAGAI